MPFTKNVLNFFQGPSNSGFRSVKVQTETFLKKDLKDLIFFLFRVPMNPRQDWKTKLVGALFLGVQNCKKNV